MKPADELLGVVVDVAHQDFDKARKDLKVIDATRALLDECEAVTNAVVYGAAEREGDTYLISGETWRAASRTLAKLRGEA